MRAALLQITGSDDPQDNLATVLDAIGRAAGEGAGFVLTPEVTNCISASRSRQQAVLRPEADDRVLAGVRDAAAARGIWIALGSIAVKTDDPDGRFANRSLLIGPDGGIVARYDKIHMFDVAVSETETYRESAGYRPGSRAVLAETPFGKVGLTICYDVRFPHLYRALAGAGAEIILVPSAFSPVTGAAHWEPLLRARAIETGAYILAAAQTGTHPAAEGRQRSTYGHALAVGPWGEVLTDLGDAPGIGFVDIDLAAVAEARRKVPALTHDREFEGP
ncbi:hydrolase, carbon-nitrogen family protein [Oceanicola granulosus HTCC2516]|uniref:Hydrolase, carbon-nitrogen family protein n=1 Tax=Oceanicola granulosus (strain ATCC BAA-861 / DSM 15982 / KCTC 12143 / HTCC2516) TaxID=314256 RepID=Q2CJR0_OCEGH|nr:carbon-nitrogen hydrolase family protein [Oceanicola granulosus]EAR53079.1 hydrolase, carbon-nitrogen family protein [Oceanicola granulosus HTCC2516]